MFKSNVEDEGIHITTSVLKQVHMMDAWARQPWLAPVVTTIGRDIVYRAQNAQRDMMPGSTAL